MAKKKKKQMRETLYCPYCKRPGVLRPAAYVYGDNNLDPEKYLYVCSGYPSCDSYIGAHKKSMRPMGTMADSDLRNKRIEAHRALDAIWKKCLDCGTEMEQGTVEGYAQGGSHSYEFTADTEKKKTGIKGFFSRKTVTVLQYPGEQRAWHCPHCKKVLMWMDAEE